ncbi:Uncharacterized conserved protein [Alteromonadaceae bacterium Bs31]|nr:Uncharacterized conserved protein [Alteromonadaceae bacterium Bs31]
MKTILIFVVTLSFSSFSFAELELEKLLKDEWLEVRSENFIVITDIKAKKAELLIQDLEHFHYFITQTLGNRIISIRPLKIIAISSRKNFKRLDLPEFWAGVFLSGLDGDIAIANISRYSSSKKYKDWGNQVLMHEYVHFATRSLVNSAFFPHWYEEGLAEYLASFRLEGRGKYVTIGNMDVIGQRLYSLLKPGGSGFQSVDIEDLLKTTSISSSWRRDQSGKEKREGQRSVEKYYARAMLTYHYLNSNDALRKQLQTYLNHINNGKNVDEAFNRSFNTSYAAMDKAIVGYVSKPVRYVRNDAAKAGIKFPEVTATVEKLTPTQTYEELLDAILRFGTYTPAERDAALQLSNIYAPNSNRVKFSKIVYLSQPNQVSLNMSNEELGKLDKETRKKVAGFKRTLQPLSVTEADEQLAALLETAPNKAEVLAHKAVVQLDTTIRQLRVGHPDGKKNLSSLRMLARSALKSDRDNAKGFYVLGSATAQAGESRDEFIREAAMAFSSAKILYGIDTMENSLWDEIKVNILLGESSKVLQLSRQYITRKSNSWIDKGYGRFFIEAQETRAKPFYNIESSDGDVINYDDGSQYSGEFKDAVPHGKGTLTTGFGSTMSGTWVNGFLEGNGKLSTSNGFEYTGQFNKGQATGKGSMVWQEGRFITRSEGQFLMGMEHGEHRFYRDDGRVFEGTMWLGSYHGEISVSKDGNQLHTFMAHLGAIRTQVNEDFIFAGSITKNYQATGRGSCYDRLKNKVWSCRFEKGKYVEDTITVDGVSLELVKN